MKGLNSIPRGRDALVASLALLLSLCAAPSALAVWHPGLLEGRLTDQTSLVTTVDPDFTASQSGPTAATTQGGTLWKNATYVYRGQIYLEAETYWFAEMIDNATWLKINGTVILNDGAWMGFGTGSFTPSAAGWYDFEVRFWNDASGGGISSSGSAEYKHDRNDLFCGFGYCRQATKPANMTACLYPDDDGSMTVFRYDDGLGFGGINVYGDPEELGSPVPGYGEHEDVTAGTTYELSCPEFATNGTRTIAYRCAGWELAINGVITSNTVENVTNCTYVCTNAADIMRIVWKWSPTHRKLDVSTSGEGTVDVSSQWFEVDATVTLTATPKAGMKFWKWTGDIVTPAMRYRPTIDVTMTEPGSLTANFYDPDDYPRIVRHVATAAVGKGDGTSWGNAYGNIATAFNAVAANPSGGEVWIKTGWHSLNNAITLVPHVTVRGGFAGSETRADEADPGANPTILSSSSYAKQSDTWPVGGEAIWTGDDKMTFAEPTDRGDDDIPISDNATFGGGTAFANTDGALLEDNEFSGLSFYKYQSYAIRLTARNVSPVVVRNCRFLACGWGCHSGDSTFWVENVPVEITDTEFLVCENPLRIVADTTVTSNLVKGCRFYANELCWAGVYSPPRASGVAAGGTAFLRVSGCLFEKCRNISRGSEARAGGIAFQTSVGGVVEDSVICRSVAKKYGVRAAALVFNPTANCRYTVSRCRFERNTVVDPLLESVSCCIHGKGTGVLDVNDSLFADNVATNTGNSYIGAACAAFTTDWHVNFANCTFENNRSIGSAKMFSVATEKDAKRRLAFANCVFRNNLCGRANGGTFVRNPEFRSPEASTEVQCLTVVNSVFEGDDAAYVAFADNGWLTTGTFFNFASCLSSATGGWGEAPTDAMRYPPLVRASYAPLDDVRRTNGTVVARGIAASSPYRRKGRPVYRDKSGDLFIYDTAFDGARPWRRLDDVSQVLTDAEGTARGLSRRNPIPDAFGTCRGNVRTALGPLDFPTAGAVLRLR